MIRPKQVLNDIAFMVKSLYDQRSSKFIVGTLGFPTNLNVSCCRLICQLLYAIIAKLHTIIFYQQMNFQTVFLTNPSDTYNRYLTLIPHTQPCISYAAQPSYPLGMHPCITQSTFPTYGYYNQPIIQYQPPVVQLQPFYQPQQPEGGRADERESELLQPEGDALSQEMIILRQRRRYRKRRANLEKSISCKIAGCQAKFSSDMAFRNHERRQHGIRRRHQ